MSDSHFASDAEREAVCVQLGQAMAEGRITQDEHEDLIGTAVAARRRGELTNLISDLPDAKLPEPRLSVKTAQRPPATPSWVLLLPVFGPLMLIGIIFLLGTGLSHLLLSTAGDAAAVPSAPVVTPTPGPAITDPQDRAFVQAMIDFANSGAFADPEHPQDIDQAAVLDIAHRLRTPDTNVRPAYLLVMDSSAYKPLTAQQKYKAGKLALSIWRPDAEAAWVELGKNDRFE